MKNVILQVRGCAVEVVRVASDAEASRVVCEYQDARGLGASDLGGRHGLICEDGVRVARVSYNGRIWPV